MHRSAALPIDVVLRCFLDFRCSIRRIRCLPTVAANPRLRIQNSALPGVRAKGMTSRMFETPVTNMSIRSKPRPKPACGTVP